MIERCRFRVCALLTALMMTVSSAVIFAEGKIKNDQTEIAVVREAEPAPQEEAPVPVSRRN